MSVVVNHTQRYRRRDHEGGGWPGTNDDVLAAWVAMPRILAAQGQLILDSTYVFMESTAIQCDERS